MRRPLDSWAALAPPLSISGPGCEPGCESAFSFWCGKVPAPADAKRLRIDDDLLVDCFTRLEGQAEASRLNFRYVVALLLMRRKRLKFEDARTEAGREVLRLRCVQTKAIHEVVNPALSDEQMQAVQEEVFKVLGW